VACVINVLNRFTVYLDLQHFNLEWITPTLPPPQSTTTAILHQNIRQNISQGRHPAFEIMSLYPVFSYRQFFFENGIGQKRQNYGTKISVRTSACGRAWMPAVKSQNMRMFVYFVTIRKNNGVCRAANPGISSTWYRWVFLFRECTLDV